MSREIFLVSACDGFTTRLAADFVRSAAGWTSTLNSQISNLKSQISILYYSDSTKTRNLFAGISHASKAAMNQASAH